MKKMAEMEQKQKALLQIIKKELDHTKRMVSLSRERERFSNNSMVIILFVKTVYITNHLHVHCTQNYDHIQQ